MLKKNHPFIRNCINKFHSQFDGLESAAISSPTFITEMLNSACRLKDYGFQIINEITIYPKSAFYPISWQNAYQTKNINISEFQNSYAIHC